jgi:tRNA(fMet)-specific endonuclease VapC
MRIALDTNRYVDLYRGMAEVVAVMERADEIVVPFIALAELRTGFVQGNRREKNERALVSFLARPGVSVGFPDEGTTVVYADLMLQLRRQGTPIPTNDVWIAALTLQHGLTLYARDGHFDHLSQIPRI